MCIIVKLSNWNENKQVSKQITPAFSAPTSSVITLKVIFALQKHEVMEVKVVVHGSTWVYHTRVQLTGSSCAVGIHFIPLAGKEAGSRAVRKESLGHDLLKRMWNNLSRKTLKW